VIEALLRSPNVGDWRNSDLAFGGEMDAQPRAQPDGPADDFILAGVGTARRLAWFVRWHVGYGVARGSPVTRSGGDMTRCDTITALPRS
jgi:hypothetical protein